MPIKMTFAPGASGSAAWEKKTVDEVVRDVDDAFVSWKEDNPLTLGVGAQPNTMTVTLSDDDYRYLCMTVVADNQPLSDYLWENSLVGEAGVLLEFSPETPGPGGEKPLTPCEFCGFTDSRAILRERESLDEKSLLLCPVCASLPHSNSFLDSCDQSSRMSMYAANLILAAIEGLHDRLDQVEQQHP